jgi:hypothetical protein
MADGFYESDVQEMVRNAAIVHYVISLHDGITTDSSYLWYLVEKSDFRYSIFPAFLYAPHSPSVEPGR